MATKKASGSAKNLTYVNPQYLGIKLSAGSPAKSGNIIVRQRGTHYIAGKGVQMGKDHTLFAVVPGRVSYRSKRKINFDGRSVTRKVVTVG
jgi:large subunit ribosomal protein L27